MRTSTLAGGVIAIAGVVSGGCGAATEPGSFVEDSGTASHSGSSGGDSGSSGGGSAGSSDAGAEVDVAEVGPPLTAGHIVVQQSFPADAGGSPDFSASFGTGEATDPCALAVADGCVLDGCQPGSVGFAADSAGTLTVAGSGGTFLGPVLVPFVPPGGYDMVTTFPASPTISAGQTLTVSGSGATVPGFGPRAVVMPSLPVLAAPASPIRISVSSDLPVAWTGGQPGATFRFAIYGAVDIACDWSAELGRATVSQKVLAGLRAGDSTTGIVYGQYVTTSFKVGSYEVALDALALSSLSAAVQ